MWLFRAVWVMVEEQVIQALSQVGVAAALRAGLLMLEEQVI
jgi:hypothetical protein